MQDLLDLVAQIVPFHMTHNAGVMSAEVAWIYPLHGWYCSRTQIPCSLGPM